MDVFCAGMYRSCSTWQYDVVAHLLERHRGGRRLGYLTGEQYADLVRREPADGGWRVLKSHEEHPSFGRALAEGRALAVYAFRDVRDVVFSMLHKRQVGFEAFVRQGMVHQILANDRFWAARPALLTQRYGDLMADQVAGVEQLAAHLGIALEPGEAVEIADEYTLEANRRRTAELARRLREGGIDVSDPAHAQHHDGHTLLHWNHVREGKVGAWRDEATPAQRHMLGRIVATWLVVRGFEADVSWVGRSRLAAVGVAERLRREAAVAQGWLRCRARCAALRHPHLATFAKRLIGLVGTEPRTATPPAIRAAQPHLDPGVRPRARGHRASLRPR